MGTRGGNVEGASKDRQVVRVRSDEREGRGDLRSAVTKLLTST